jgi:hypothetical protein
MTEHDSLDALIAAEFADYRQVVPDLFPVPPAGTVFARARPRIRRRRIAIAVAAAAAVAVTVAAIVAATIALPPRPDTPTPQPPAESTRPAPSTSVSADPSGGRSSARPSPSSSSAGPATTGRNGTSQTGAPLTVVVYPDTVAAGGQVSIAAECGFPPSRATAESTPFGRIDLDNYEAGRQGATTTVRASTPPGRYVVTARCADGRTGRATLTVV